MKNTNTYCVYRHVRLDTNKVFYIGISKRKERPYCAHLRTKLWKRVYNKTKIKVEIIASNISREKACELEVLLISEYGRMGEGQGTLVNFTDGGEGTHGRIVTQKMKDKISLKNKGSKRTIEQRLKMSKAKIGKYRRGDSPHAVEVIDTKTGVVYDSIIDASEVVSCSYDHLKSMLNGRRKNNTTLIRRDKLKQYEK